MRLSTLFILLSLSYSSISQEIILNTRDIDSTFCKSEPSKVIYNFKNWELYHTSDDRWNGIVDSTECPNLTFRILGGGSRLYSVDLATVNPEKALFLKYTAPENEKIVLNPNRVYSFNANIGSSDQIDVRFGEDCQNGMCSGLILVSEHTDDRYPDTLTTVNTFPFTEINRCDLYPCYPTQKTANNEIKHAIYKISLNAASTAELYPSSLYFDDWNFFEEFVVDQPEYIIEEAYFQDTSYRVDVEELFGFWGNALVLHQEEGLPSIENPSYIEIIPEIPKDKPTDINLIFDYSSLNYQEHTQIRGALVENSDSLRHPINQVFISGEMCITVVEVINTGGSKMIFDGGSINFADSKACLQFRDNSALIVEENISLNLGQGGVGNLNLRSGGSMILKEKSQLLFDGKLILTPYQTSKGEEDIYLDLQPHSHFVFGKDAHIENNLFGDEMFLYVKMNGGKIDVSNLSREDRAKIKYIHNDKKSFEATSLIIYPNPASEKLTVLNSNNIEISNISIFDIMGKELNAPQTYLEKSKWVVELDLFQPGLYTLEVTTNGKKEAFKIFKN